MAPSPALGRSRLRAALAFGLLALSTPPARAAGEEASWPCVQRLQPTLSDGQLWPGPPLDQLAAGAELDPALAPLPTSLASNDLPLDAVPAKLAQALEPVPAGQRPQQAALLFRATLEAINRERGGIIAGIERFFRSQRQLAERITEEGRDLARIGATGTDELGTARAWNMRVFDDRQRTIRNLCDQPVRLEQRAFALARILAGQP